MSAEAAAREKRTELIWLAALLLVVIVLRVFALGADPLRDTSGGFIDDWGDWVKNARLHFLWGRWIVDDANLGLYTAFAHTMALRGAYALIGEGLAVPFKCGTTSCPPTPRPWCGG